VGQEGLFSAVSVEDCALDGFCPSVLLRAHIRAARSAETWHLFNSLIPSDIDDGLVYSSPLSSCTWSTWKCFQVHPLNPRPSDFRHQ
jgi:hypothetical protein